MEDSKQPSVEDMIAVVEAGHRHLVEDLKNNHNHMMTTVENHHSHLINGLRYDLVIASNRRNMLTIFLAGKSFPVKEVRDFDPSWFSNFTSTTSPER